MMILKKHTSPLPCVDNTSSTKTCQRDHVSVLIDNVPFFLSRPSHTASDILLLTITLLFYFTLAKASEQKGGTRTSTASSTVRGVAPTLNFNVTNDN